MLEAPPRRSRTLGAVYLLYFVTAISGGLLVKGLVVHGDALATARNFAEHPAAVRGASALGVVAIALYLAVTALFCELFRSVSGALSRFAGMVGVAACSVQAAGEVAIAPLRFPAAGADRVGLRVVAEASLAMHERSLQVALALFGSFNLVIPLLIARSALVPRVFAVLMAVAGIGWLAYLWPPLADSMAQVIQPLGFLAEAILMLWLLVRGVEQPSRPSRRSP